MLCPPIGDIGNSIEKNYIIRGVQILMSICKVVIEDFNWQGIHSMDVVLLKLKTLPTVFISVYD